MNTGLRLNPANDPAVFGEELRRKRRVQIPDFFEPSSAERLYQALRANRIWYLTFNDGAENSEMPVSSFANLPLQQRNLFLQRINGRATSQFQFLFIQYYITEAIRRGEDAGHPLHAMHDFMNSEPCLAFMRALAGEPLLKEADVLASLYQRGHFLTNHDDSHSSRHRVAAYVVNLTKNWNANWGGHLAFFNKDGNIEDAYCPSFNTLNIFLVPQHHAVQQVTPFAGDVRTSFAGWLQR